jgi:hypothetical protein
MRRNIHKVQFICHIRSDYWLSKIARNERILTRLFIWLKLGVLHIDSSETGRIILLENTCFSRDTGYFVSNTQMDH